MGDGQDYGYHFGRAQAETIKAIQALSPTVEALHRELSLRHSGRAIAGLFEAQADRMRAGRRSG